MPESQAGKVSRRFRPISDNRTIGEDYNTSLK